MRDAQRMAVSLERLRSWLRKEAKNIQDNPEEGVTPLICLRCLALAVCNTSGFSGTVLSTSFNIMVPFRISSEQDGQHRKERAKARRYKHAQHHEGLLEICSAKLHGCEKCSPDNI